MAEVSYRSEFSFVYKRSGSDSLATKIAKSVRFESSNLLFNDMRYQHNSDRLNFNNTKYSSFTETEAIFNNIKV